MSNITSQYLDADCIQRKIKKIGFLEIVPDDRDDRLKIILLQDKQASEPQSRVLQLLPMKEIRAIKDTSFDCNMCYIKESIKSDKKLSVYNKVLEEIKKECYVP